MGALRSRAGDANDSILVSAVETSLGSFFLATRGDVAIASAGPRAGPSDPLAWGRWSWPEAAIALAGRRHTAIHAELRAYFAGKIRTLTIPVSLEGRPYDVAAWQAAREIPYGKTLTYGELALELGRPGTARAAGRAMSVCPLPVLVPCHRVVGAGGRRCGEPEGWKRREALLALERSFLEPNKHEAE
jgi:methylated-DNA-[protein]-cysteine S-methyltransferase